MMPEPRNSALRCSTIGHSGTVSKVSLDKPGPAGRFPGEGSTFVTDGVTADADASRHEPAQYYW